MSARGPSMYARKAAAHELLPLFGVHGEFASSRSGAPPGRCDGKVVRRDYALDEGRRKTERG